ncbi:Receptor-type tyrosine-protein phosphatase gamma [Chionoecetes opilio]|uniref:protein-tyrosine-phosphatase n=1 Tax=Chionoecetes opilio TaxID=41210 RepID=A0A8J4Y7A5_CHIOP|nr:Receptor-type tyrosine-protein phosphatase gamma [Chionoecetes opilio]
MDEAIYENLKPEESSATIASRIPLSAVEAYLNKVIGSKEAGDDFKTVPSTLPKSMEMAQRPENKSKNRFKNNHPYDDTRVVLSCLHDDPNSDYINANHVQGYGRIRYIASQGPKSGKVSTIADFWRMIVEQNITVIVMVANFVEMGKSKVGEYFNSGQTLNFDGFEVVVDSTEQLPHFTVSSLVVKWGAETYPVQHYHYTKWPDHGISTEAKSIAEMLCHFQSHHKHGGTVVHCSAGIGRTGTVLQVLLMCEMLSRKGYFNPIEVLGRLRMSRARLVENEAQYNLSLEILEEIMFGKKTIVSADDLTNHLDEYVLVSKTQFARAKALPSPLSYNTSNLPDFQTLNRNQSVLPADSNRCYLQPRPGMEAWLAQYINAIRVPTSNRQFMLATEHPLLHNVTSFWRLVVESECTIIIFVNSLDSKDEGEFPTMIMEPGSEWQVDQYELKVEDTVSYGSWLKLSTLTLTSNEECIHRVDVYQSVKWPVDSPLPPSPYILLSLAELLQIPRSSTAGPPLLCCRLAFFPSLPILSPSMLQVSLLPITAHSLPFYVAG